MILTEKRDMKNLNINRRKHMTKMAEFYFPLAFIVGQLAIAVIAVATISA